MTSIKEYASKHKVSHRTARRQLDRMVEVGEMVRTKGPSNMFVYEQRPGFAEMRWHDPFNRTKELEVARSVQQNAEEKKGVAKPAQVSKPKALALDAKARAHTAALQHWFKNARGSGAHADRGEHIA